ncbi:hypothetical protein ABZ671_18855 [Micromonospora sp. NPDC006766]|uniref:hypothetical protein n=1 Tax=Micromonospora sp. NPDC006766 TaxID=3154778 RepID=UPI0033D3A553
MTAPARVRVCPAPVVDTDGTCPGEPADGSPFCPGHGAEVRHLTAVRDARAELGHHLVEAARHLRLAMAAGRTLGDTDSDWVSWTDLDRALGQALTGVHAAKHLTPEPDPLPGWLFQLYTT